MFESLTDRLSRTLKNLRGQGRLSEDNIRDSLREVRMALLEADVALPVVKDFIEAVRSKALGQEVITSLSPGQALIKVVNDELVAIMGESQSTIDLNRKPPVIVLMAGLQGAGKTTTVAKLARRSARGRQEVGHGDQRRRLPSGRDRAAANPGAGSRCRLPFQQQRSKARCHRA